jgi:hypothetical protein
MADYFYGKISVGGKLKRADLPEFLDCVKEDYTDSQIKTEGDLLSNIIDGNFTLGSTNSRHGQYQNIEEFCVAHDLSYYRSSEDYGEYTAECAAWSPGMPEPSVTPSNVEGDATLECSLLRSWLVELKTFLKKVKTVADAPLKINSKNKTHAAWARLILATNKIDTIALMSFKIDEYNPIYDPLPDFSIVD